jgi:NAD(P)H-dependent FMN reductase
MIRILVILGSTRDNRFSERAGQWVVEGLEARGDMEVELVDLRDHPLPFFDGMAPARTLRDYPSAETRRFGELLDGADGFVIVTPEYNHGYSAVLKNAIDHTFVEWQHKPVTFVGWGNVGGARAIEQLRLVMVELESAPLRHAVSILPDVLVPALRAEVFETSMLESLAPRLTLLGDDLHWWATALANARAADNA